MSAFSEKIAKPKTGLYRVADFEDNKEITHVISHLLEDQPMFEKKMDILCFEDTGRQLQLNITNAEFLITNFGDDPATWSGKRVTLALAPYGRESKLGIRLRLPDPNGDGAAAPTATPAATNLDDEIPF